MSYIYLKKATTAPKDKKAVRKKTVAVLFLCIGVFFLLSAVFPILKYQIKYSINFSQLLDPLSVKNYGSANNILGTVDNNYTQISNWFENDYSDSNKIFSNHETSSYLLSVPKLKIRDAVVSIGSMDLKKSLIQYPQTALPGQLGDAIVFGHSVLPQFFNPKNYLTIFSTLHTLKQGDEIIANYGGVEYKYIVDEMFEVKPTDLSVLAQDYNHKSLTLITCSPPGTYLRRLVIKSSLAVK